MFRIKKESFESLFLILYFSISPISKLIAKIGVPRQATYLLLILLCLFYFIKCYQINKFKLDVLIAFVILAPITFFGVMLHHADFNSANEMYAMVIIFFPAYFILRVAKVDELVHALRISAYISLAVYLPNAFLVENIRNQYITYAYDILFPLSIVMYYALKEKHWFDIIISIVGTVLLAVFGSRGALVSLALFFLYVIVSQSSVKRFLLVTFLVVMVLFAYLNLGTIIVWLGKFGISSYALNRISRGEAFTSLARNKLYDYIINVLLPNNYWGYGPVGSRALMPMNGSNQYSYPHQLFLEILVDYGLIIGTVFSIGIITVVLYLLIKSKGIYRQLTAMFCVASFFPLMISGSFYAVGTIPYIFAIYMKFREESKSYIS